MYLCIFQESSRIKQPCRTSRVALQLRINPASIASKRAKLPTMSSCSKQLMASVDGQELPSTETATLQVRKQRQPCHCSRFIICCIVLRFHISCNYIYFETTLVVLILNACAYSNACIVLDSNHAFRQRFLVYCQTRLQAD